MRYYNSDKFNQRFENENIAQRFLSGIYNQNKHKVLDFRQEVVLPINSGSERWWQFTVRLNSLMVLASYEFPGADEDPQIVAIVRKDGGSSVLNAKTTSTDIDVGSIKAIDVEVMKLSDLKLLPHAAEIVASAIDTSDDLTEDIIDEVEATAREFLNTASALIPYGNKANNVAQAALKKLLEEIGSPKEIGDPYHLFKVNKQYWKREPEQHIWHRYKFVAFVEEDPDDEDIPYEEIYITMWELKLESEQAIIGEATEPPPPEEEKEEKKKVKSDSLEFKEEKPGKPKPIKKETPGKVKKEKE